MKRVEPVTDEEVKQIVDARSLVDITTPDPWQNIFPRPISDEQAWRIISTYLLGNDWYCIDPLHKEQMNAVKLAEIMSVLKYKQVEESRLSFIDKLIKKILDFFKF